MSDSKAKEVDVPNTRSMATSHRTTNVLRCKALIVGDACVGKTCLASMFHSGGRNFSSNYTMTKIADVKTKSVPISEENVLVELYLFDCAGQSIFHQDSKPEALQHMDHASAVVLVYDVTSRESFKNCSRWLQKVRTHLDRSVSGVLVANKTDLIEDGVSDESRVVTSGEGEGFAKEYGLRFFEVSAKDAKNVDAPFKYLAETFARAYAEYAKRVSLMTKN